MKALDRATRVAPRFAPAFYQRGVLLSRSADMGMSDALNRYKAHQMIDHALDLDRDNPLYLVELGRLRLKTPILRIEAERIFKRALTAAEKRDDTKTLAAVQFEIGQIYERRYQSVAHRYMLGISASIPDPDRAVDDPRYTREFLESSTAPLPDAGELDRRKAEDRYRAALLSDPSHSGAASGLFFLLYDGNRYEEMVRLAQELRTIQNSEPRLWLALGLALHRLNRDVEATRAFDSAITRLTPDERREMLSIQDIVRDSAARSYRNLGDVERNETDSMYWDLADPLKITDVNEARVEFLARVAAADLRFTSAEFAQRGWKTDRGTILIRYGEPPVVATFAPSAEYGRPNDAASEAVGRVTTLWWYPESKLRFIFIGPPAMNYAFFAGSFRAYAENARNVYPARFDNLGTAYRVDSIPVQVARFRADDRKNVETIIAAELPLSNMTKSLDVAQASVETQLMVTDGSRRVLMSQRDTSVVKLGSNDGVTERTWRRTFTPGDYLYRVEARDGGSGNGARGLSALPVSPFPIGSLSTSDILVARTLRLKPGISTPRTRDDLVLRPNASMEFARGDTLFLYWENYGVKSDSARNSRIRVDLALRVAELQRAPGLSARVLGGIADAIGTSAKGDDRVALRYERTVAIDASDRVVNYLALDLGNAPFATFDLELTVTDLVSGQKSVQHRTVTIPRK
jgi:GWxTD domain-containing protein